MADGRPPRVVARRHLRGLIFSCRSSGARANVGLELIDLSEAGARFRSAEDLRSGEALTLEVRDPVGEESFRAQGEVVSSTPQRRAAGTTWLVDVQFTEVFTPEGWRDRFTRSSSAKPASPSNKRIASRFHVADYVITCLRTSTTTVTGHKRNLARRVVNLSGTGAQLAVVEHVNPGTKVDLIIHFNRFSDTFHVPAEVRWCRPAPGVAGATHLAGVSFAPMTSGMKRMLKFAQGLFSG